MIIVTYRDTERASADRSAGGCRRRADHARRARRTRDRHPARRGAGPERSRPGLAGRLHGETNGNPFFVREVLAHLAESGELEAPDQLREVIARRVARLSEPAQAILAVAAVAGPVFSVAVVECAVGEQADLLDAFDEATAAGLLIEQGHGDYAFAHALVRQTIYRGLSSARRARLHRRVGEALEAVVDVEANLEALAYHFAEAATDGQADKAADYALAAGRRATRRLGYEQAAAHYQRGLDALALATRPDEERRRALLLALGRTHYEPLPDLGELPAWLWRRLPRAGKVAVTLLTVVGIAAGAGVLAGHRTRKARGGANRRAATRAHPGRVRRTCDRGATPASLTRRPGGLGSCRSRATSAGCRDHRRRGRPLPGRAARARRADPAGRVRAVSAARRRPQRRRTRRALRLPRGDGRDPGDRAQPRRGDRPRLPRGDRLPERSLRLLQGRARHPRSLRSVEPFVPLPTACGGR